jgi:hypothetical protein
MVGADIRARDDAGTRNGWIRNEACQSMMEDRAMRLLQMTIRRLMIVVAVVAGLLALRRLVAYLLWYCTTDWGLTG